MGTKLKYLLITLLLVQGSLQMLNLGNRQCLIVDVSHLTRLK